MTTKLVPVDIVLAMIEEETNYEGASFLYASEGEYDDHGSINYIIYFLWQNEYLALYIYSNLYDFKQDLNYTKNVKCRITDETEIMYKKLTLKQFTTLLNTLKIYWPDVWKIFKEQS